MSEETTPHATSMVVWDVPSPAAVGRTVTAKIGVRCEAGCILAGHNVEVRDLDGTVAGEGVLGDVPLDGTDGLFWAEVTFAAPCDTGIAFRAAAFAAVTSEPPHLAATAAFSFRVDPPPEHHVTVRVVHQTTGSPIDNVEVRMDLYAGSTDERGEARFDLPGGVYTCSIRKSGFEADPVAVTVDRDVELCIQAAVGLTREEYDAKLSSYENHPWG